MLILAIKMDKKFFILFIEVVSDAKVKWQMMEIILIFTKLESHSLIQKEEKVCSISTHLQIIKR